ncbi:MAG: thioredoxin-like domain-containing protein [Gemmataceae bacterium]
MAKTLRAALFIAALACWAGQAQANPKVIAVLKYTPRQPGVQVSSPSEAEIAKCDLQVIKVGKGAGYELKDPTGKLLRRFLDTDGDGKLDVWSYYKEGVEVYREIDVNKNEIPDHYRWLGTGGMKWGLDLNEDGKIDTWRMISAEEAAQEAFLALAANDYGRFKALLITEAEMRALKLAPKEMARLTSAQKTAQAKFEKQAAALAGAEFERVESVTAPSCFPADEVSEQDVIKFPSRQVLYKVKDKHDLLETGELIQVGYAWRLTDAPGQAASDAPAATDPNLQKLYNDLAKLDAAAPPAPPTVEKNAAVAKYNLDRAEILAKLAPIEPKAVQKEIWTKQIFDNLGTAHQAGSDAAMPKLDALCKDLASKEPAGAMTAYATFRLISSGYLRDLSEDTANPGKVQDAYFAKLSKFVESFPKAEDTPDALQQLAMGSEYNGKDEEAKRWYQQLVTNFPSHRTVEQCKGAIRRLDLVGREMELKGPLLKGPGAFDLSATKGKVVVVYYWAQHVKICDRDFASLKTLASAYGGKGLEIVTVNLDESKDTDLAKKFVGDHLVTGHHVHQDGPEAGLNGPLATYYGINSLPTVVIIGRDGRVQNRTIQVNDLEAALKKAL